MADVESRREARRRKILENSEQRMKILAGQGLKENLYKDDVPQIPASLAEKISTDKENKLTETITNETYENQQNNARPIDPDRPPRSPARGTVKISKLPPQTQTSDEPKVTKPVFHAAVKKSSSDKPSEIFNLLRVLGCVLLALIARWVLRFGFGLLYFQSIIAPFVALEIALFSYQLQTNGSMNLPHKNNMMVGALILCGIKPDVINMYGQIMGYVGAVTEDFALYLFTFLLSDMFS